MKTWENSLVVLDESDWLMFDGTAELMEKRLRLYSKAATVVGLTGSALTSKELHIVKSLFKTSPIKFPTLSEVDFDKRVHLKDVTNTGTQKAYTDALLQLSKEQC